MEVDLANVRINPPIDEKRRQQAGSHDYMNVSNQLAQKQDRSTYQL
jgi:hypothetical protein